jgi:hypothetical protein
MYLRAERSSQVVMKIKTTIPIERLKAIAVQEGCQLDDRETCIRIMRGTSSNRLYIARTRDVARVNINGFRIPDPELAKTPDGGPVGTFLQVVRFDLPEVQVLKNFRQICRNLDGYPPEAKKPRIRPAGLKGTLKGHRPITSVIKAIDPLIAAVETAAQHAARLIAEYREKLAKAAQMGFPLSKKTTAEYRDKVEDLGFHLEDEQLVLVTQFLENEPKGKDS